MAQSIARLLKPLSHPLCVKWWAHLKGVCEGSSCALVPSLEKLCVAGDSALLSQLIYHVGTLAQTTLMPQVLDDTAPVGDVAMKWHESDNSAHETCKSYNMACIEATQRF